MEPKHNGACGSSAGLVIVLWLGGEYRASATSHPATDFDRQCGEQVAGVLTVQVALRRVEENTLDLTAGSQWQMQTWAHFRWHVTPFRALVC